MALDPIEDFGLEIDQQVFRFWESCRAKRSLDTFSTVEFSAPFEAERREFRETFRPFKFQPVVFKSGDQRLFTGRVVGVNPSIEPNKRSVSVTAYALPGVLHDCTAPVKNPITGASFFPLEFRKLKLQAIASILCAPFGMEVDFRGEDGAAFDKVKLDPTKKIFEFLVDLAQHRNFVLTDNTIGQLLCWRSVEPGNPVARLKGTEQPVTKIEASFSPQEYYSEISGFAPTKRGRSGGEPQTVRNPWLPDVLRPRNERFDKIEKADARASAEGMMGRMFAEMVSYKVDVATCRQPDGELWRPNTTVTLHAPDVMIYRETELLVRDVEYNVAKDSASAQLTLVLPGVFDGKIPETLPWNEED